MQARRQRGWLRRLGPWRGAGLAAALIAAGALAYPAMSSALHPSSQGSGTVGLADPALSAAGPTGPASGTPSAPSTTGAPTPTPTATGPTSSPTSTSPTKSPTASRTAAAGSGSASAPLAGRIKPGQTHKGVATFYQGAQNTGACLFDRSPDHFTAAMNEADYDGSNACGAYVQVRGSSGATITVRVTNLCPYPCRVGQLDLDPEAYKLLAPLQTGETPITWKLVSPNISGSISIRYKTGSSQWWCGIQVINHRNPVARLEAKAGSTWKSLPRADYNYFLSAKGSGCGGQIRITDIYGQRLVVGPLPVKPDVTQPTAVQFSRH